VNPANTVALARTKPSKSLVVTRAKEILRQFEAQNKSPEEEVIKLKQNVAMLDHIVASKGGSEVIPVDS
jgi:hypothetical protein